MKTVENLMRIVTSTCCSFVVFGLLTGATQAQTSATTAAKSPSPELVGALTKQLGITPTQATGGAGTLFKLAKSRLNAADFSKVSAAVPGMSGFLKAAPSVNTSTGGIPGISSLSGALPGAAGGLANAAQSFQKLGLSSGMIGKFVPVLTQFVQSKGGANVASLLSGALK
jgi:hypothetical protein